jgi:hypothetical protein
MQVELSPNKEGPMSAVKVAYIMSRFPEITQTFVLYEMLALEELGIPVSI